MARRLGAETIELWTKGEERFGQKREARLVRTFQQCWVEFRSSDEGSGENENIMSLLSAMWIPAEVELEDADDYFVWTRRPNEKYSTDGDVGRHYDRRGNLRACVVPVVKRT